MELGRMQQDIIARSLLPGLVNGLDDMRRGPIIHLNINPHTIFRCAGTTREEPTYKLADFRFARQYDEQEGWGHYFLDVDEENPYLAPEVKPGQPRSEAQDLYSVGTVLRTALTGSPHGDFYAQERKPYKSLVQLIENLQKPIAERIGPNLLPVIIQVGQVKQEYEDRTRLFSRFH